MKDKIKVFKYSGHKETKYPYDYFLFSFCCSIDCKNKTYYGLRKDSNNRYGCVSHTYQDYGSCEFINLEGNLREIKNINIKIVCAWKKFVEITHDKT